MAALKNAPLASALRRPGSALKKATSGRQRALARLAALTFGCLAAWPAAASAAPSLCPEGATHSINENGQEFCLFENIDLPNVLDVAAYCYGLEDGYIGFSWAASPAADGYVCPEYSYRTDNGMGADFCLFGGITLPSDRVKPYCKYLSKGTLGFSWRD